MRPRIQLVPSRLDKVLEMSAAVLLTVLWAITIYAFIKMPEIIPTHYNDSGKVDDYGSKATILLLPVVATILYTGITIVNRYPHIFNYPTAITEVNARRQYTLATRMLRFLKLAIVLAFTEITVSTYLITQGIMAGLGSWFLPVELAIIGVPMVVALVQGLKKREQI